MAFADADDTGASFSHFDRWKLFMIGVEITLHFYGSSFRPDFSLPAHRRHTVDAAVVATFLQPDESASAGLFAPSRLSPYWPNAYA